MYDVCLYHGNCPDGFGAAWAYYKVNPNAKFIPVFHDNQYIIPTEVHDKNVLIVDFCYPAKTLLLLMDIAKTIFILDHHVSGMQKIEELLDSLPSDPASYFNSAPVMECRIKNITAYFDTTASGALLCWQKFHANTHIPWLIMYLSDNDLNENKLADSLPIAANIKSWSYTFSNYDLLATMIEKEYFSFVKGGEAILHKQDKDVEELFNNRRKVTIGEYSVWVCNVPYTLAHPMAMKLAQYGAFGATYYENSKGEYVYSLRSFPHQINVADIAKIYGGGGHPHASSFTVKSKLNA